MSRLARLDLNCTMPMMIEDIMISNSARVELMYFIATNDSLVMEKNRHISLAQLDLN